MKLIVKILTWFFCVGVLLLFASCNMENWTNVEYETLEFDVNGENEFENHVTTTDNNDYIINNTEEESEKNIETVGTGETISEDPFCHPYSSIDMGAWTPESLGEQIMESTFLTHIGNALLNSSQNLDGVIAFDQAKNLLLKEQAMIIEGYSCKGAELFRQGYYDTNTQMSSLTGYEQYTFTLHNNDCYPCNGDMFVGSYSNIRKCHSFIISVVFEPREEVLSHVNEKYTISVDLGDDCIYKRPITYYSPIDSYAIVIDDNTYCLLQIRNDCEDYEEILAQFVEYCSSIKSIVG